MSTQPGWHPDPSPDSAGGPPQLRYWDGGRWTEHTAPYPQQEALPQQPYGQPYPQTYGEPYPQTYGQSPYAAAGKQTTTPDGAPLAGWWQRVGATLIDGLIVLPITAVLWIPFYGRVAHSFRDYFDEVDRASRTGAPMPSSTHLQTDLLPTLALMTLISVALGLVWTFGWLRLKQATPGKLALGLRVRQRDVAGPLPWGVIARRWAAQYAVVLLSIVPLVGNIVSLYSLLDALWASWDGKRQCLHDKVAGTNVVRVR